MNARWMLSALLTPLVFVLSENAVGHGGQYRGASDMVPPNLRGDGEGSGDIPPPPPPPGSTTTPNGPGRPQTGGGPGGFGTGVGGIRATTGINRRGSVEGYEQWEFWWEHNKEPFLDLRARLGQRFNVTESPPFFLGRGKRSSAFSNNRPTAEDVRERIIPELLLKLGESHPDIADSAAIALSRTAQAGNAEVVLEALVGTLRHKEKTAREAAALGLGILCSREAVPTLRHLMLDTAEGRRLTGADQHVEDMVRAFAAAALGMIGDPSVIPDLKNVLADQRLRSQRDLQMMATLALGLFEEGQELIVPYLVSMVTDRSINTHVRCQAPISIGRLNVTRLDGSPAARAAIPQLVECLLDDRTDFDLCRSLAISLGMLAGIGDPEPSDALRTTIERCSDAQTRHFAIMALAQIGARDKSFSEHEAEHHKMLYSLMAEMVRTDRPSHQPFGALAVAIHARAHQALRAEAGDKIHEVFLRVSNPSYRGAMAVALGLLGHRPAQEDLWTRFEEARDSRLQGFLALSLGLLGETSKAETLREMIAHKGIDPALRLQLARALGLMADVRAVDTLADYLKNVGSLSEGASCAQALGLIGDRSVIDSLTGIVRDTTKGETQRGFAIAALGILAERTELPWNSVFSVNSNYRAKGPALAEILDIL